MFSICFHITKDQFANPLYSIAAAPRSRPRAKTSRKNSAAPAARRTGGHHHKRASVPCEKERLSRRQTFRQLTGIPLANLGLGLEIGGSIPPDLIRNWPSQWLGEELDEPSENEEEEDDEEDDDEEDDDEENAGC